jgi:hypothetical protein
MLFLRKAGIFRVVFKVTVPEFLGNDKISAVKLGETFQLV